MVQYSMVIQLWKKLVNKETVLYVVFGILTTAVNFAAFWVFDRLLAGHDITFFGKSYLFSNFLAWIVAVLFAFITNKIWVFESRSFAPLTLLREFSSFIAARVFSFFVEEGGLYLFIDKAGMQKMWAKVIVAVFVVVINYFFSKFLIFTKKKDSSADK
jgi:putative flippase GtrA